MNLEHLPEWAQKQFTAYEWPPPKPWAKLYRALYTTDSHMGLDGISLGFFAALLPLVNRAPCLIDSEGTAWLIHKNGTILGVADLKRETRFTEKQIKRAAIRLQNCQSLDIRSGVIGIPNFERWQMTPECWRKKKAKQSKAETPSTSKDIGSKANAILQRAGVAVYN